MEEGTWIPISQGVSASQLVWGAVGQNNENLYIGRAKYLNNHIPGKVSSDLKSILIGYGWEEHQSSDFEVLINDAEYSWVETRSGSIPRNAVIGGVAEFRDTLYVARAMHNNLVVPGKAHPSHCCAYIPSDLKEHSKQYYELLVKLGPKEATLTESIPEPLPEPARLVSSGFEWVEYSQELGWPENAVVGGHSIDGCEQKDQFIARANHNSNLIIGYAYKNGIFYGTCNGNEIQTECYEIFVKK